MESVKDVEACIGEEMLAWVAYHPVKKCCFVYPQYVLKSGIWKSIDKHAFPNRGAFFGAITGGTSSAEVQDKFGSIAVARINLDTPYQNKNYDPNFESSMYYSLAFNPSFQERTSEFELEVFSEHMFSAELIQVVDARGRVSFSSPLEEPIGIEGETENLVCKLIVVRDASGVCYGPFSYAKSKDQEAALKLSAPSINDYRVARLDGLDTIDKLLVRDQNGQIKGEFVEKTVVDYSFNKAEKNEETLDWMPHTELLEVITRAINASNQFDELSRSQISNIKAAVRNFNDTTGRLTLDDKRRQHIVDWLSGIEATIELPSQVLAEAMDSISNERLAQLAADDLYFPQIKNRIIESEGIQASIAEERRNLEASLVEIKRQCSDALELRDKAEHEAEVAQAKADEAQEQLEKVRDEALEQKREELEGLESKIEQLKEENARLQAEYERIIVSKDKIEKDVENIISNINDDVTTSTKILESEILRKVVSAVSGVDFRDTEAEPVEFYTALRSEEDSLKDSEIIEQIFTAITHNAGRQLSVNDTINLLICLSQGYITTLAGQPGTGKTSLCNILVGALGLTNDSAGKRFTEVNVENGWTSYKDYIGYYNPLAKTYEKANASVYNAMLMLSKESDDIIGLPPYIFLLDEANLSPIEHYWSPFLRACDAFQEEGTTISLGGSDVWHLPRRVRFLATVNFDHTTEALSQRFLDRSWVITLDPDFIDTDYGMQSSVKTFSTEKAFSSDRLFRAFGYSKDDVPNQENAQLLDDLIRVCRAHSLPISPRSQLMMRRYIATASRLMSLQSKDGQYAPLDYAFSQKVLPQISGPAETVGKLVDELLDKCSQLKTTKRQLDRMKEFGKDSGFYQYFI